MSFRPTRPSRRCRPRNALRHIRDGQDQIELTVNEGDETNLKFVARLGERHGDLGGPKPRGYPIVVKMALDGDGILRVTAHDGPMAP